MLKVAIIGVLKTIALLLIIAIPLYLLFKFNLKKNTQKSDKSITILAIVFATMSSPIVLVIATVVIGVIVDPTPTHLGKPIDSEIVSAKQIVEYLSNEIQKDRFFFKYDNLAVGKINMRLDIEHRGEVNVTFVEINKNPKKIPNVIIADLDTRKNMFYRFSYYGREGKLYPGVIHIQNWKIDSKDAVRIAEDFVNSNKNSQYDRIWLLTNTIYKGNKETWEVLLTDSERGVSSSIRINPYSGEVLN